MKKASLLMLALCLFGWPFTSALSQPPPGRVHPHPPGDLHRWILNQEAKPTIGPNAEILLFIHGMDSRAEEADDITKALFMAIGSPIPPPDSTGTTNPNIAILNQLLQKFKSCILEKYETQQDMKNRGLPDSASNLTSTNGLQPRDVVVCVAGNQCSLASRATGFAVLQAKANSGNAANFQMDLESIIPKDCFQCAKHAEEHTKHVHCTMEAGGNSGISFGPNGPIGPAFEACNMGVDLTALANQVIPDIGNVIGGIANPSVPPDVTGGITIATNHATVHFKSCPNPDKGCPEACDNPDSIVGGQRTAVVPPQYFEPTIPPKLLDGQNEGRLITDLRAAAQLADPNNSLRLASISFSKNDSVLGNAFADLSVTGHKSFATFKINPPNCKSLIDKHPQDDRTEILNGCRKALNRAYQVANFLRTGQRGDTPALKTRKTNARNALGWIAVSGEDDSPHRPVNVPSSDFPQYDLSVAVEAPTPLEPSKQVTVNTRYTIAQSNPSGPGKNLVVISVDLPTSGYADNLNYNVISPLLAIGMPKNGNTDFAATGATPLLDFIEAFVVRFTDRLDQMVPFKANIKAVMGGSLGGNMTFRLGRRDNVPWFPEFVVWSPASIWDSLGGGTDVLKHQGPLKAWESADQAMNTPGPGDRGTFFRSWDQPIVPLIIPMAQSDTWTSDYYLCKKSSVAGARLDRQETFDPLFLAWHWRLGAEQLLFSHQNIDPHTNQPLFMSNRKPMLLACGLEDHVPYNDICPATQKTASLMKNTPGRALFLDKTGHSLDNERRTFWAQQIIQFLGL